MHELVNKQMAKIAELMQEHRMQELETAKQMEEERDEEIRDNIVDTLTKEDEEKEDEECEKCSNCGGDFDGGNCFACKMD